MLGRSEHLRTNQWLVVDYLFGLRGYGLVVYGALPASLAALGAFKAPDQAILVGKIAWAAVPFICAVAVIPVVLTFVLVRQRLANWYLLPDYLVIRAATITLAIVLVSSLVCAANGLLVGTYVLLPLSNWWALSTVDKARPIAECLLLTFAYLVGSSTLFLTVVKENSDLPLLPNKAEVESLKSLRDYLRGIATSPLQTDPPKKEDLDLSGRVTALTSAIDAATTVIVVLGSGFTRLGRKRFYEELSAELGDLKAAAQDVGVTRLNWQTYWAADADAASMNDDQKRRRAHIARLRRLRING